MITASQIPYLLRCPGRYHAQEGLERKSSEYALAGEIVHAELAQYALTGKLDFTCGDDAVEYLHYLDEFLDKVIPGEEVIVERRFKFYNQEFECVLSGQPDLVIEHKDKVVIIDYKTGFNDVDEADVNAQLWCYAGLFDSESNESKDYELVILQRGRKPSKTLVPVEDIRRFFNAIINRIKEYESSNLRIPGLEQCRYCQACGNPQRCPESVRDLVTMDDATKSLTESSQISYLLNAAYVAEKAIERVKQRAKEILFSGGDVPGYYLAPGRRIRYCADITAAWARLEAIGVPEEAFFRACSLEIGKIEEAVAEAKGMDKKEAKAYANDVLGDALQIKETNPILTKKKGGE
jgi:hypothetical protein